MGFFNNKKDNKVESTRESNKKQDISKNIGNKSVVLKHVDDEKVENSNNGLYELGDIKKFSTIDIGKMFDFGPNKKK
jgi:hypothetical protein